uniref:COI1 F-box domain-containing protein n=1 Tax=Fagus sylvatica TaxID=28930 RepID=A0A2N9HXD6_FAGSY
MAALLNHVHFHDLPDEIISNIFSLVTNTRTRNAISLVCLKWHLLERSTRTSLTLRGNIRDLFLVPSCFQAVTNLDLSFLSPWGHPLINPDDDEGYTSEDARISHATLVSLCVGLPLLEELVLDVCHNVRDTCPAFDLLNTKCPQLKSLKLGQFQEPIRELIQRLHIDCVWESNQQLEEKSRSQNQAAGNKYIELEKRMDDRFSSRTWAKLHYLSLWISVGELLSPLSTSLVGLENCPVLEEIQIQIEGDCRKHPSPSMHAFGLSSLECYPRLSKMKLDCGGAIGYALTAPYGYADLSLWERFYLKGVGNLSLTELNYWPPQDKEVNQRTISLPAAGLLAQCVTLREDYYPAPENDMSTEVRVHSCYRFEDALNRRQIPD